MMAKRKELEDLIPEKLDHNSPCRVSIRQFPKTSTQRSREYRARQKLLQTSESSADNQQRNTVQIKTSTQRSREYRARQKLLQKSESCADNQQSASKQVKTSAERSREYRERQKLLKASQLSAGNQQSATKQVKTSAERSREYRERQKLLKASELFTGNQQSTTNQIKTPAQRSREYRERRKRQVDGSITVAQQRCSSDKERRKLWIKATKRKLWKPTINTKLCLMQFEERSKFQIRLTTNVVPTNFPDSPEYAQNQVKLEFVPNEIQYLHQQFFPANGENSTLIKDEVIDEDAFQPHAMNEKGLVAVKEEDPLQCKINEKGLVVIKEDPLQLYATNLESSVIVKEEDSLQSYTMNEENSIVIKEEDPLQSCTMNERIFFLK